MRKHKGFNQVLLVVVLLFLSVVGISRDYVLNNQYDLAFEAAGILDKGVIVIFSSSNCYYCTMYINETMKDEQVLEILRREFVVVEIFANKMLRGRIDVDEGRYDKDAPFYTYEELFGIFGVRGVPASAFFGRDMDFNGSLPGYLPADQLVPVLKYVAQALFLDGVALESYDASADPFSGRKLTLEIAIEDLETLKRARKDLVVIRSIEDWDEMQAEWQYHQPLVLIGIDKELLPEKIQEADRLLVVRD